MQLLLHSLKLFRISLLFIGVGIISSIVFGFFRHSSFTLRYVFDANYTLGVVVIISGFFLKFFPSSMMQKDDKLFDHTSFAERSFIARKRRHTLSNDILLVGIITILLAGLAQIILSFLL